MSQEPAFNSSGFFSWLKSSARKVGKTLVEKALVAYYMVLDPAVPKKAKVPLVSALVYLGLPIDAVSDLIPGVGFTDDIAVLAGALALAAVNMRPRHVRAARQTMSGWGF